MKKGGRGMNKRQRKKKATEVWRRCDVIADIIMSEGHFAINALDALRIREVCWKLEYRQFKDMVKKLIKIKGEQYERNI